MLIGESLANVVPGFDLRTFQRDAHTGLDRLELKDRARHVARAMANQLPADIDKAGPLLIESFGPPLEALEGNGLAVFFYMPHSAFVAEFGISSFATGMNMNLELTKRFTAEFSIRPFLIKYRSRCLKMLRKWAADPNPHVRRLVSEGTRPRLPWAMRLTEFQTDPQLSLPLLEMLKDDHERYVRRSVANHLGDIAKDHPDVVFDVCERWLSELKNASKDVTQNRHWIIRHALRHPANKGVERALMIRQRAG